jgi:hypothetical protein
MAGLLFFYALWRESLQAASKSVFLNGHNRVFFKRFYGDFIRFCVVFCEFI